MKIMKSLKILSLLFALFLIGTVTTQAQNKRAELTKEQKEELAKNMEDFFALLNLTEEQKPEFEAVTKKYAEQMKAVKDGGGRRYQKYKKVKSIWESKNKEMKKLLSEEQYVVYLDKQEEMQEKIKERNKSK